MDDQQPGTSAGVGTPGAADQYAMIACTESLALGLYERRNDSRSKHWNPNVFQHDHVIGFRQMADGPWVYDTPLNYVGLEGPYNTSLSDYQHENAIGADIPFNFNFARVFPQCRMAPEIYHMMDMARRYYRIYTVQGPDALSPSRKRDLHFFARCYHDIVRDRVAPGRWNVGWPIVYKFVQTNGQKMVDEIIVHYPKDRSDMTAERVGNAPFYTDKKKFYDYLMPRVSHEQPGHMRSRKCIEPPPKTAQDGFDPIFKAPFNRMYCNVEACTMQKHSFQLLFFDLARHWAVTHNEFRRVEVCPVGQPCPVESKSPDRIMEYFDPSHVVQHVELGQNDAIEVGKAQVAKYMNRTLEMQCTIYKTSTCISLDMTMEEMPCGIATLCREPYDYRTGQRMVQADDLIDKIDIELPKYSKKERQKKRKQAAPMGEDKVVKRSRMRKIKMGRASATQSAPMEVAGEEVPPQSQLTAGSSPASTVLDLTVRDHEAELSSRNQSAAQGGVLLAPMPRGDYQMIDTGVVQDTIQEIAMGMTVPTETSFVGEEEIVISSDTGVGQASVVTVSSDSESKTTRTVQVEPKTGNLPFTTITVEPFQKKAATAKPVVKSTVVKPEAKAPSTGTGTSFGKGYGREPGKGRGKRSAGKEKEPQVGTVSVAPQKKVKTIEQPGDMASPAVTRGARARGKELFLGEETATPTEAEASETQTVSIDLSSFDEDAREEIERRMAERESSGAAEAQVSVTGVTRTRSRSKEEAQPREELVETNYIQRGKVQGVQMRDSTVRKAKELGIRGAVKNIGRGSRNEHVRGRIQGPPEQVIIMKKWLRYVGSPRSKITSCDFTDTYRIPTYSYLDFRKCAGINDTNWEVDDRCVLRKNDERAFTEGRKQGGKFRSFHQSRDIKPTPPRVEPREERGRAEAKAKSPPPKTDQGQLGYIPPTPAQKGMKGPYTGHWVCDDDGNIAPRKCGKDRYPGDGLEPPIEPKGRKVFVKPQVKGKPTQEREVSEESARQEEEEQRPRPLEERPDTLPLHGVIRPLQRQAPMRIPDEVENREQYSPRLENLRRVRNIGWDQDPFRIPENLPQRWRPYCEKLLREVTAVMARGVARENMLNDKIAMARQSERRAGEERAKWAKQLHENRKKDEAFEERRRKQEIYRKKMDAESMDRRSKIIADEEDAQQVKEALKYRLDQERERNDKLDKKAKNLDEREAHVKQLEDNYKQKTKAMTRTLGTPEALREVQEELITLQVADIDKDQIIADKEREINELNFAVQGCIRSMQDCQKKCNDKVAKKEAECALLRRMIRAERSKELTMALYLGNHTTVSNIKAKEKYDELCGNFTQETRNVTAELGVDAIELNVPLEVSEDIVKSLETAVAAGSSSDPCHPDHPDMLDYEEEPEEEQEGSSDDEKLLELTAEELMVEEQATTSEAAGTSTQYQEEDKEEEPEDDKLD